MASCYAMTLLRLIWILIFIVSTVLLHVDSRALRKRRQFSSASYYISGVNPYANPNVDPASLTYPSGPFYDPPNYIHTETMFSNNANNNLAANSLYNQALPQMHHNFIPYAGAFYGNNFYGYAPGGFNVRFPNWNQGNIAQYYTGGTGTGLSNTLNYWGRSFQPGRAQNNPMNQPAMPMAMMMPPPPLPLPSPPSGGR